MSHWDFGRLPAEQQDEAIAPEGDFMYGPGAVTSRSPAPDRADLADGADATGTSDDEDFGPYPITYERGRIEPDADDPFPAGPWPGERWRPGPAPDDQQPWPPPPRSERPGRYPRPGRRWLIPAVAALGTAAIGGAAVLLTGGHPGNPGNPAAGAAAAATRPATAPVAAAPSGPAASPATVPATAVPATAVPATVAPPLSLAQARGVLARYTAANNAANAQRSIARLATIETGSSDAIDKILYLRQGAAGAPPYPAFGPASATYYIPRTEPAAGPRWFVVQVGNAFFSSPAKVSSTEYLLFLQATAGAPWRNAIEPYLLPGARTPRIAIGGDGRATAVAATATSLAVVPVRLPKLTATALDGAGPVAIPANLADRTDARSWQEAIPALTITDRHGPATAGQAFALLTNGGGALVFYTVAAAMTITGPAGSVSRLNLPGLYPPARPLARAALQYRDQFAAWDPPAGSGTPRIIADYSGITRKM